MSRTLFIDRRFCGPPQSGNGGYSAGLVAGLMPGGAVEVTLRSPPPLARDLTARPTGDGFTVFDGDVLIAEGRRAPLAVEIPAAPSFEDARLRSTRYAGFERHFFPTCFVCGTARDEGDGLRIYPGRLGPEGPVAAPWVPDGSLCDANGFVRPEHLWAALDCAGYWGATPPEVPPALLGRITAEVEPTIRAGDPCVVLGFGLGVEGRKIFAGTAILDPAGRIRGRARQTWIAQVT